MAILDKLVERKDVAKYIDSRIEILKFNISTGELQKIPERKRERAKLKIRGRITELANIKDVICNKHTERKLSTKYWEDTREFRENRK